MENHLWVDQTCIQDCDVEQAGEAAGAKGQRADGVALVFSG